MREGTKIEEPGALTVGREGDATRVAITGALDQRAARELLAALTEAYMPPVPPRLVIDLSAIEFIDSAGLRVLRLAHDGARRIGCELTIVRGPDAIQRVLELMGLDRELPLADRR